MSTGWGGAGTRPRNAAELAARGKREEREVKGDGEGARKDVLSTRGRFQPRSPLTE
jgi:hypothetical protein